MKKTVIVLPAYDPDETIMPFVAELSVFLSGNLQLLVVNDGSAAGKKCFFDKISQIRYCRVIQHAVNRGKGAALKTAFSTLLAEYGDDPDFAGCVTADCDGQHSVRDILKAAGLLAESENKLILGCRSFGGDHVPWKSRFGNECTIFIFKHLLRLPISDTQTGLRGIPVKLMRECLAIRADRFEFETEMLLRSRHAGCTICEYPIQTIYFDRNSGTHFRPVVDALRIYRIILWFLLREFLYFVISSLSAWVLDYGIFLLLFCHLPDSSWKLFISCGTARLFSSLWNFTANRFIVFRKREKGIGNIAGDAGKYYLLAVILFAASWGITQLTSCYIADSWLIFIKPLIDILLFFVSFFTQRHIIFRKKNPGVEK